MVQSRYEKDPIKGLGYKGLHLPGGRHSNLCVIPFLRNPPFDTGREHSGSTCEPPEIWRCRFPPAHGQLILQAGACLRRGGEPLRRQQCSTIPTLHQSYAQPEMPEFQGLCLRLSPALRTHPQPPMRCVPTAADHLWSRTNLHTAAGTSGGRPNSCSPGSSWREHHRHLPVGRAI